MVFVNSARNGMYLRWRQILSGAFLIFKQFVFPYNPDLGFEELIIL